MRALITGITGQDGSYLAELLLSKGYEVHGIRRRCSVFTTERIDHLEDLILHHGDLTDTPSLMRVLGAVAPDEIYHLAAQSHVAVSFEEPEYTAQADAVGTLRLLESVRLLGLKSKVYNASTSELYGFSMPPQSERTPFRPSSPYACAKLYAHSIAVNYREAYGLFVCNGILFNHESPRRGETFVTRKITKGLSRILHKGGEPLKLGNLEAERDWGHAKDYVKAMWLMLQHEIPDDYVIATGKSNSVKDFVEHASWAIDRDIRWKGTNGYWGSQLVVTQDPQYLRPKDVPFLRGDYTKANRILGWSPEVTFYQLVKEMMDADAGRIPDLKVA